MPVNGYDLALPAIDSVVNQARGIADSLDSIRTGILGGIDAAAGASGSAIVSGALASFRSDKDPGYQAVANLVRACTNGCVTAVNTYLTADDQMAAHATDASGSAPTPDIPGGRVGGTSVPY